ncbi:MAG: 5'/3'-nucleotidase SurE [Devosia sp.]|nr:5'/3'-nucleotidase SurE [Devosia sp.]
MRILITNDDGVAAPGIALMREIARALSDDVWVVAPDGNQSGAGHRFTLAREMTMEEREPQVFAVVGGSPADCVVVGMTHLLVDHPPDVVLSGVNAGQNLGDIIHCSGTAAGAREGALQGAIGIAMSQAANYELRHEVAWDNARRFGPALAQKIIDAHRGRDHFYNVNFPFCLPEQVTGVRVVPHQRFSSSPFRYYPSHNAGKFFVAIPETPMPLDHESDFHVLTHGNAITVTPLRLAQTDMDLAAALDGTLGFEG